MPILSVYNYEMVQSQLKLTPKMHNLGRKLLEYNVVGGTIFQ